MVCGALFPLHPILDAKQRYSNLKAEILLKSFPSRSWKPFTLDWHLFPVAWRLLEPQVTTCAWPYCVPALPFLQLFLIFALLDEEGRSLLILEASFSVFHMHQSWSSCLLSLLQSPMGPIHLFVYEQFVLPEVFSPSQVLRPVSHLFLKADTEGWFTMLFTGISSFPGAFQLSLGSLRYESRLAISLFVKTCTPHWFLPQLLVLKTCLQISMHLQRWKNWQQKSSSSSGWPTFTLMISYSSTSQGADLQEFYPCKLNNQQI